MQIKQCVRCVLTVGTRIALYLSTHAREALWDATDPSLSKYYLSQEKAILDVEGLGRVNTNWGIGDQCEMNKEHENAIQFIEAREDTAKALQSPKL